MSTATGGVRMKLLTGKARLAMRYGSLPFLGRSWYNAGIQYGKSNSAGRYRVISYVIFWVGATNERFF